MSYRIAMISLGCAKNLVNSEQMLWRLCEAGHTISPDVDGADAVIINTCGFIESAKSEAIDNILEMAQLKKEGRVKRIIVTGCLSERYRDEVLAELPEIDALCGVSNYGDIDAIVEKAMQAPEGCPVTSFGDKNAPIEELDRIVTTGPGWAYLRIAEGCSNRCAFCVIPDIRGRYRSRRPESVLEEARALAQAGVKELIVIAQDITRYGLDLEPKCSLAQLVRELCRIDGIEWVRLHYLYPDLFTDELIDVIASEPKVVKYLDIPIQHINNDILRRMNRRGTGDQIRELFAQLRDRIPDLVIRTSLIAGLPGETQAEFEQLCGFLREAKLERAGVFPFSPEEGTPAAAMPDRCSAEEAERRAGLIMDIQAQVMDEFCDRQLGRTLRVLCEGYDRFAELYYGRSWADSPDVDGKVFFTGPAVPGEFASVKITDILDGDLLGEIAGD